MSQIIHYDTLFAKKQINNTFIFENKQHDLQEIKNVTLASLEMPISFFNVRSTNASNSMSFTLNGIPYSITIVENNYFTIASILLVINKAILSVIPASATLTIDVNSIVCNKLIASSNGTTLAFAPSILISTILGVSPTDSFNGGQLIFSKIFNLNPDSFLTFHIAELSSHYNSNSMTKGQYKIPLLNSYAQYLFYSGYISQTYTSPSSLAINDILSITLFDRFGFELPVSNGLSYSLQYDI
jgi:hypothetical protein